MPDLEEDLYIVFLLSCSFLWADFDCMAVTKTRVYLKRSKTSPTINASLNRDRQPVLILCADGEEFNIESVIEMAATRASRGSKLRTIRIFDEREELNPRCALELRKHVHMEYDPEIANVASGDSDDSDEED